MGKTEEGTQANAQGNDYYWTETDQSHRWRRNEILRKYPQIKDLCVDLVSFFCCSSREREALGVSGGGKSSVMLAKCESSRGCWARGMVEEFRFCCVFFAHQGLAGMATIQ